MEEAIVKGFIEDGIDGSSPTDHYGNNTTAAPFTEGDEIVGTIRILGGRCTNITIRHQEHANSLQSESPPRYGYLGRFTATIKNKYQSSDRIILTNITLNEIESGSQL